jgi:flavin-binding protein dodecin
VEFCAPHAGTLTCTLHESEWDTCDSSILQEDIMSVARVTELIAASPKSFEDAIQAGVSRAVKTLKNVEGVWVANQKCVIKGGKIAEYRVNLKVTFILE